MAGELLSAHRGKAEVASGAFVGGLGALVRVHANRVPGDGSGARR